MFDSGPESIAAWNTLVGCWQGVASFDGLPASTTFEAQKHSYYNCCDGSKRILPVRFAFFLNSSGVPVLQRSFEGNTSWNVWINGQYKLSLSSVIILGNAILHNLIVPEQERSQDGNDVAWEVRLKPPILTHASSAHVANASVPLECQRFVMRANGEQLVASSVVYYPWHNGTTTLRYHCPLLDNGLASISGLPTPESCPPSSQFSGCSLYWNYTHELGLHGRAATVIEYDLLRSHADDCHIDGASSIVIPPDFDADSQNTVMIVWLAASTCLCVACCLVFCAFRFRRLNGRTFWRPVAVKPKAAEVAEAIGASMAQSEDVKSFQDFISSVESSADHFSTDVLEVFSVGTLEHWLLHPRVFTQLKLVAGGGFGAVYEGSMHRSSKVALKVIKSFDEGSQNELRALTQEARVLRRLRHPNIVLFQGVTRIPCDGKQCLALVLEWVEGGHLGKYLGKVVSGYSDQRSFEGLLVNLMLDISRALLYMHSQDPVIMHRDLKPPNVLVEHVKPPRAKVTDFGLSAIVKGDFLQSRCGTRSYMAPEVAAKQPYDASADIYSFGAIIWFVLTASNPSFDDTEESRERMKNTLEKRGLSATFRELCEACLCHDKQGRPSAAEAFETLNTLANDMNSTLSHEVNPDARGGTIHEARVQL